MSTEYIRSHQWSVLIDRSIMAINNVDLPVARNCPWINRFHILLVVFSSIGRLWSLHSWSSTDCRSGSQSISPAYQGNDGISCQRWTATRTFPRIRRRSLAKENTKCLLGDLADHCWIHERQSGTEQNYRIYRNGALNSLSPFFETFVFGSGMENNAGRSRSVLVVCDWFSREERSGVHWFLRLSSKSRHSSSSGRLSLVFRSVFPFLPVGSRFPDTQSRSISLSMSRKFVQK